MNRKTKKIIYLSILILISTIPFLASNKTPQTKNMPEEEISKVKNKEKTPETKISHATEEINFFIKYGKHLPFPADDIMVMTVTPEQHKADYGYYAIDLGKNGGDLATLGTPVLAISDGIIEEIDIN